MQLKNFILLGVLIILKICSFPTKAALDCTAITDDVKTAIEKEINGFRRKHGVNDVTVVVTDLKDDTTPVGEVAALLRDSSSNPENTAAQADVFEADSNIKNDKAALIAIIQAWIKTGKDYKYDGIIEKDMEPFVRLLWKNTEKVHCAVCPDDGSGTSATNAFGCRFMPAAQLYPATGTDTDYATSKEIQENLPKEMEPGSGPKDTKDKPLTDTKDDEVVENSVPKNPSKLEKTIRSFILLTSITTAIVLAVGIGVALLTVAKIILM